jgi:L-arabinokinase
MSVRTFRASAPGRLDVMGGIADYSGSLVLQKSIVQETSVELILRTDYQCNINSKLSTGETLQFTGDFRIYLKDGKVDYSFAQQSFKQNPEKSWVAYILGCALALQKEKGITFKGADMKLVSDIPNGKGVASSASVEVATVQALAKAFDLSFSGTELPVLAQRIENLVVGAPCGLMDQLSSYFGKPDTLLPIVCQPNLIQSPIEIPIDIHFIGIDSGIRHQVAGASYRDVRCAAFMGYTIIGQAMGVSKEDIVNAKRSQNLSSLPFNGYLSNISVSDFESKFQKLLPDSLTGKDFLSHYEETIDPLTHVDPNKFYNIRRCTAHPIHENYHVHQFQEILFKLNTTFDQPERRSLMEHMGTLMLASHASYSLCGLGTERTDEIVSMAMATEGITGARITGGGNGGTVCLLVTGNVGQTIAKRLQSNLSERYNENLTLFV